MAMLLTLLALLLVLWLLGVISSVGGAAIHLLLLVAAIVLAVQALQRAFHRQAGAGRPMGDLVKRQS